MNKRATALVGDLVYIILAVLVVVFLYEMFTHYQNSSQRWEDFYAKQIAYAVDMGKPGDNITIDMQQASVIAKKNGILDYGSMVKFDNNARKIFVKLGETSKGTSFTFFNDVRIVNKKIELGVPGNVLHFEIAEPEVQGEDPSEGLYEKFV